MSIEQDVASLPHMAVSFDMHLGHQRAGGINGNHVPRSSIFNNRFGHAMR